MPRSLRRAARATGLAWLLSACAGLALAEPPADLDAYVGQAMSTFGPPGMAVAVTENGATVVAKGYGVKRLGSRAPVDAHTVFPIGSESKAFTAAALAILVDRGKLSWSDRVVYRLPGFAMYDPYATAHMTVRDLLTHRSGLGLGEGDLLVFPATRRSRTDMVHALRYLKPATGFREQFAYDNILYIVAGALLEKVSGQSWEDFVRQNIFVPAGMTDALADYQPDAPGEVALHARNQGALRGVGPQSTISEPAGFDVVGPAGGINASATDMARWMQVMLAHGALGDGRRLFSEAQAQELFKPVVVVPAEAFSAPARLARLQPRLQDYALGWFVEDYQGHLVIEHSGAVFGAVAVLYLIPEQNVGIAVQINSEDGAARRAVAAHLLDHYLGLPPSDWIGDFEAVSAESVAKADAVLAKARDAAAAPSNLPPERYAGRYLDAWYGAMTIAPDTKGGLTVSFDETPGMVGVLEPVGGDRFRTRWRDHNIEDAYLDFTTSGGTGAQVTLKAVSPLADFSFDYQDLHFTRDAEAARPTSRTTAPGR